MFVIQRILESEGNFTLLDKNKVISQHDCFRMFATTNTIGLGDTTGLYHGTQQINQGQMDRWSIVSTLNYLPAEAEEKIVMSKVPNFNNTDGQKTIKSMVALAELTRNGFMSGDLSTVMSPRTVITWAENTNIIEDIDLAFKLTFLNKCDEMERPTVSEYYQRCFGRDLIETTNMNDA
jgi:cobaltochelatase CobS